MKNTQTASKTAKFAAAYIDNYGLSLVPLTPKSKKPYGKTWTTFTDSVKAVEFFNEHEDCGIGVNLGVSRICSADLDWPEAVALIEQEYGFKFGDLVADNPTIKGKALRIMFKMPADIDLGYCKLNWIDKKGKSRTVFELRASKPEDNRQDVLPPSIHPETGEPYEWVTSPSKVNLKEPPNWLKYIWLHFDEFKRQLEAINPESKQAEVQLRNERPSTSGVSVAQQFDDSNDLRSMLERYGYKQMGRRWLSPHSESGIPGVHVMQNKCWIHHASDPLCSESSGYPVGPFDLFTQYEHGGDYRASTKAAARLLGISQVSKTIEQASHQQQAPVVTQQANKPTLNEVVPTLPQNKDGKLLANYDSMAQVIACMDVGYDDFLECPMIMRNGKWERFDDADYVDIAIALERIGFTSPSMAKIKDIVRKVMVANRFDSAKQWLDGLAWDGVDRCSVLFSRFFGAEQSEYEKAVSLYFTSAMAARIIEPGAQCDMCPILLGKQGAGKTSAVKALAPIVDSFTEIDLSTRKDSDLARQLRGKLIGELGELRGLKTKESEWIKAWITRTHEEWTPKFVEHAKVMPRRCVFIGTTNEDEFLVDTTGNRRWLPIKVGECSIDDLKADIEQIWAQAAVIFKAQGVLWKDALELAQNAHDEHMVYDDVVIDSVRNVIENNHKFVGKNMVRLMDLAEEVCGSAIISRAEQHRLADALRQMGYTRMTRRFEGKLSKVFVKE